MRKRTFAYSIILVWLGVMIMTAFSGCGKEKHKLIFDGYGFESKKTEYAAGEKVTVYFDFIATDTDYYFSSPDVEMEQTYDNQHGYIFTFTMPDHDVTLQVESHNSMEYDPDAYKNNDPIYQIKNENIVFDYYDATVATVGGDGYDELVLYTRDADDLLILARYSQWGDFPESSQACLVPPYVLEDCMAVVEKYQMASWSDGLGMTGRICVVKFLQDDNLIRISSDVMPEDGMSAFNEISRILGAAWGEFGPAPDPSEDPVVAPEGQWYCPECGSLNDDKNGYCPECGQKKPE